METRKFSELWSVESSVQGFRDFRVWGFRGSGVKAKSFSPRVGTKDLRLRAWWSEFKDLAWDRGLY